MPPLSSEQIYDELTGSEVKQILLRRVQDLLDQVADFQPHLTLPRVRMALSIHLDIYGRRNTALDIVNDFLLRTKASDEAIEVQQELEAVDQVNADSGAPVPGTPFDGTGAPPDQIRVENELPVHEPVRDRVTRAHAQRPTVIDRRIDPELQGMRGPGGRPYAVAIKLERSGPAVKDSSGSIVGAADYLPGREPFTRDHSEGGAPGERTASIQKDFRETRLGPEDKE